ncbi:EPSP synthase-domain-containing protein [Hyaloraphidium curvatum]|nr:EPSP synthase-domain-containing protein [Hyaloraphidium curvatum]
MPRAPSPPPPTPPPRTTPLGGSASPAANGPNPASPPRETKSAEDAPAAKPTSIMRAASIGGGSPAPATSPPSTPQPPPAADSAPHKPPTPILTNKPPPPQAPMPSLSFASPPIASPAPALSRTPSLGAHGAQHPSFAVSQPVRVSVLGHDSYIIGSGLTGYAAREVVRLFTGEGGRPLVSSYVVLSDKVIGKLHGTPLLSAFQAAVDESFGSMPESEKPKVRYYALPPGEANKTREKKAEVEDWMLSQGCTRDSVLICLGGGVVGDLGGFVAATFMRGIPVIQFPTTLLAMVDSSIGGKTAVDSPSGKNLIGAFHQPKRIYADLDYLRSLPLREFIGGLAEVVKTAAFWSEEDFGMLESSAEQILDYARGKATDPKTRDLVRRIVVGSARVKAYVVSNDEKEGGLRNILNFGHSVGHAIEAILAPDVLHGEAVAIGMVYEAEVSRNMGICDQGTIGRLVRCLASYGLPTSLSTPSVVQATRGRSLHIPVAQILEVMKVDKKNQGGKKRIVLLRSIGNLHERGATAVKDDVLVNVLSPGALVTVPPSFPSETSLQVPGSKSISNRALVMAALGKGTCRIRGLLHSDDTQVMLHALRKLGCAAFEYDEDGRVVVVKGGGGRIGASPEPVYLGNAGTASRFLTTVACLLPPAGNTPVAHPSDASPGLQLQDARTGTPPPAARGLHTVLTGNARMKQRPIGDLVSALQSNGCRVGYLEREGSLPLRVEPTGLPGGRIELSANISSQYVSSILMAAPYAEKEVELHLTGEEVVSQPYIDMTIAMMKEFGVDVECDPDGRTYRIPRQPYVNPGEYVVEADASSATYPLAFAAATGTAVTVSNIGSKSLQGDARFAVDVLRPMGCTVEQTEATTTVCGPPRGELKPLGRIDMEPMTDAFLTASALAALAEGTTEIYGIANQRVKECDRIAAVASQLRRFGLVAEEMPDGIRVLGRQGKDVDAIAPPPPAEGVKCFDDHRVAMSFSVLACGLKPGSATVLRERKCVEKTWPEWWDALETELGALVAGYDYEDREVPPGLEPPAASKDVAEKLVTSGAERQPALSDATVVFIGMRGAGKSTLARVAASGLGRIYVDMDEHFEATVGETIQQVIKEKGWDEFRRLEVEQLRDVLDRHPTGAVVACGGGIVETEEGRELVSRWCGGEGSPKSGEVVHIRRRIEHVIAYLLQDKTRPAFPDDLHTVWKRRLPWFKECSSAEFVIATAGDGDWPDVQRDLLRFLRRLLAELDTSRLPGNVPLPPATSYFLALTFPDVSKAASVIEPATRGCDAVELRVDLLKSTAEEFVGAQVSLLRRLTPLPIIFTVRTVGQGGKFPDATKQDVERMFDLLEKGLKWGCEFVDMEITNEADPEQKARFAHILGIKGNSRIIASYHDFSGTAIWDESVAATNLAYGQQQRDAAPSTGRVRFAEKYDILAEYGDIVKLIGKANSRADNRGLESFLAGLPEKRKPVIALNMGAYGQETRALNSFLTPVTHPALPIPAAPGQLSVKQIVQFRELLGVERARRYYLFGTPIAHSMSPTLHNTGFEELGFGHRYSLSESGDWQHVLDVVESGKRDGTFGGASVTIPLKEEVIKLDRGIVDELTESAKAIGSLNTVVAVYPTGGGIPRILGDNTDWLGMRRAVLKRLESVGPRGIGVVLGGGGTARAACYVLRSLGVSELRIWNRTGEKADVLSETFGGTTVGSLGDLLAPPRADIGGSEAPPTYVVIATVPGDAQAQLDLESVFSAQKPPAVSASNTAHGVVVELAMKPRRTPLLSLIDENKAHGWSFETVEGIEILLEQGFEQFVRWTGRKAPEVPIRDKVYAMYKS